MLSVGESSHYYSAVNMSAAVTLKASILISAAWEVALSPLKCLFTSSVAWLSSQQDIELRWHGCKTQTGTADCLTWCHSRLLHQFIVWCMDMNRQHKNNMWYMKQGLQPAVQCFLSVCMWMCVYVCACWCVAFTFKFSPFFSGLDAK